MKKVLTFAILLTLLSPLAVTAQDAEPTPDVAMLGEGELNISYWNGLSGSDGVTTARRYGGAGGEAVVVLMSTTRAEDLPPDLTEAGVSAFIAKDDFSTVALWELWDATRSGAANEGNGAGTDRGGGRRSRGNTQGRTRS